MASWHQLYHQFPLCLIAQLPPRSRSLSLSFVENREPLKKMQACTRDSCEYVEWEELVKLASFSNMASHALMHMVNKMQYCMHKNLFSCRKFVDLKMRLTQLISQFYCVSLNIILLGYQLFILVFIWTNPNDFSLGLILKITIIKSLLRIPRFTWQWLTRGYS